MSRMIVQKFGGTSVGSEERIASVAQIIQKASSDNSVIVVVSAMSGETNRLIKLAKSLWLTTQVKESLMLLFQLEKKLVQLFWLWLFIRLVVKAKSYHCLSNIYENY